VTGINSTRLGATRGYVTSVARGWTISNPVLAAFKEEQIRQRLIT
jgi:hypothetical protein